MLSEQDIKILIECLNNATIKGKDAQTISTLYEKLNNLLQEQISDDEQCIKTT
jgi:hypothetical protein